jgi:hypothetical protein
VEHTLSVAYKRQNSTKSSQAISRVRWSDQIPDDGDRDGPRNVGFIQTPAAADSPRRLRWLYSPRKLRTINVRIMFLHFILSFANHRRQINSFVMNKCFRLATMATRWLYPDSRQSLNQRIWKWTLIKWDNTREEWIFWNFSSIYRDVTVLEAPVFARLWEFAWCSR